MIINDAYLQCGLTVCLLLYGEVLKVAEQIAGVPPMVPTASIAIIIRRLN
jgi:hypothetical protein